MIKHIFYRKDKVLWIWLFKTRLCFITSDVYLVHVPTTGVNQIMASRKEDLFKVYKPDKKKLTRLSLIILIQFWKCKYQKYIVVIRLIIQVAFILLSIIVWGLLVHERNSHIHLTLHISYFVCTYMFCLILVRCHVLVMPLICDSLELVVWVALMLTGIPESLYVIFAEITFWGVLSGILHKFGIYWKLHKSRSPSRHILVF